MRSTPPWITAMILLAACSRQQSADQAIDVAVGTENGAASAVPPPANDAAPVTPITPPAPVADTPEGVARSYFDALARKDYAAAYRMHGDGGQGSGMSEAEFAAIFRELREYRYELGAPGRIEGAAGSLYSELPVTIRTVTRAGKNEVLTGTATVRRVNDVPGATVEQRRWHIAKVDLKPR